MWYLWSDAKYCVIAIEIYADALAAAFFTRVLLT